VSSPVPSPEHVRRIAAIDDPVIRNLQITQCYHELSGAMAAYTGPVANWCTFATWASKQAGQTIRKEDLARLLERRLKQSTGARQAAEQMVGPGGPGDGQPLAGPQEALLSGRRYTSALERASDAVARGNKKVFEEIGFEFARYFQSCLGRGSPDEDSIARFCEGLRPGEPPEGQGYLRLAFAHYTQALRTEDAKARAELILLANVEVGFHEQTRLQPEIAESLDAGYLNSLRLTRQILAVLFPASSWLTVAYIELRRLLGRPTITDLAIADVLKTIRTHLRKTITDVMMTLSLPSGVQIGLGEDLRAGFPDSLREITNEDLRRLFLQHDPTPDSPLDSGTADWASLADRLHFIIDLFRCYQEDSELLEPPFTPAQVIDLNMGVRPAGRL
jgi:hypothetical protein